MKISVNFLITLVVFLFNFQLFAQNDIIEKIFSDKPTEYKNQIQIIDTIFYQYYVWNTYEYEDYSYDSKFGLEDFNFFVIYKNTTTNKCGVGVVGENTHYRTEPLADSIYFLKTNETEWVEKYDDNNNYISYYQAKSVYFVFENQSSNDELWILDYTALAYNCQKTGDLQKDVFKAVSFAEVNSDEYGSAVTGIFVNLRTNQIINSAVLNEQLVSIEAYAYRYDYYDYEYGYYDYGYDYETPVAYSDEPYFETRLSYEPVELIYIISDDTIKELVSYTFISAQPNAYLNHTAPAEFSGVWKSSKGFDDETYLIIDKDDIYTDYNVLLASVDLYQDTYRTGTLSLNEIVSNMKLSPENQKRLEGKWRGSTTNVKFIETTSWTNVARFKDFFILNDDNLAHIYFEFISEAEIAVGMDFYYHEKVYSEQVYAFYDGLSYATMVRNAKGEIFDLTLGGFAYYYNYNLSVAEQNIDSSGDLVLTTESIGNVQFKTHSPGDHYLGEIELQWVGDATYNENSKIVLLKSNPYKIKDENGAVICDDVAILYVDQEHGLNLYNVSNSNYQQGIIGPDGKWLVPQEFEMITATGPLTDSYYGAAGFPLFFVVYKNQKVGLLDSKGNWIIPMEFDAIDICKNDIITIKDDRLGLYAFDGKKILDNNYFIPGYYGYSNDCYTWNYTYLNGTKLLGKGEYVGLVDKNLKQLIPFEYMSLTPIGLGESFIAVNSENKTGIVSAKNEKLLDFDYDYIVQFGYDVHRFVASKDGKQGVIDGKGNVIIPFVFYSIQTYSEWNSNVIYVSDENYKSSVIDTTGKSILGADCDYVYYYPDLQIFYCSRDINFSFYDRSGNFLYAKSSFEMDPYNSFENVQIAANDNYDQRKYGSFELTTGKELLPFEFESLYPIWIDVEMFYVGYKKEKMSVYSKNGVQLLKPKKGVYLDNYFYEYLEDGAIGYFIEISDKKGKSQIVQLKNFK